MSTMPSDFQDHFTFLPQGAIVQKFKVGNRNIVLGFEDPSHYTADYSPFFGETIGRCANRIADAEIKNLNGRSYKLAANNGVNTLHGGPRGWGKRRFNGPEMTTRNGSEAVKFTYRSENGEEGFPGTVELKIWYSPSITRQNGKEKVSLEMEYEAELVGDEVDETVINVCNHSYFNIADGDTIQGTIVKLATNLHQVTSDSDIPTGEISAFPGITANEPFTLGQVEPDIDHCFIVNDKAESVPIDTRNTPLRQVCNLRHPGSGLQLEVFTTEPAFQFYTGKYIDVPSVDGKPARGPRSGLCIEASRYVNAVNDDRWKSMVLLKRGQRYGSRTVYTATEV